MGQQDGGGNGESTDTQWPWRIVIEMNEQLGVRVGSNFHSPDVVEMLLYRALKAIERDLTILRLSAAQEPRITPATHIPRGLA